MKIVIIDYGMGNIFSIKSAFRYLGLSATLSSDFDTIRQADRIILPGVGAFGSAMHRLKETRLDQVLKDAASINKIPFLGICLGMQLLGVSSSENGFQEGLGLINEPIEKFNSPNDSIRIPHVGFNTVNLATNNRLYRGLKSNIDFYFTHSYRMNYSTEQYITGTCCHGEAFVASFEKDNICGTQYHPEKSQSNGLKVLKNFVEWEL
jgi:imidazole glycerol-phosphate synthase subunit HisH